MTSRKVWRIVVAAVAVLWLGFAGHGANAAVVEHREIEAMAQEADMVVMGKVVLAQARISEDGMRIQTDCVLEVEECFKGDCHKASISFTRRGGKVGRIAQHISGEPTITEGDEMLLFLENVENNYLLMGLGQGKFGIMAEGHSRQLRREGAGITVYHRATQSMHPLEEKVYELEDLRNRIREALIQP